MFTIPIAVINKLYSDIYENASKMFFLYIYIFEFTFKQLNYLKILFCVTFCASHFSVDWDRK